MSGSTLKHWGTLSDKGGTDNRWPAAKRSVRKWIADHHTPARVFEVYGPGGLGALHWRQLGAQEVAGTQGDAVKNLNQMEDWSWDTWDIDPYSNPLTALTLVSDNATSPHIGIFATDGIIRKAGQMGASLPTEACNVMGWPKGVGVETRHVKRYIYYHYAGVMRVLFERMMAPRYAVQDACVVKARGNGCANYWGIICAASPGADCGNS